MAAVVGVKCCALSSHRIRDPAMHRGGGVGAGGFHAPRKVAPAGPRGGAAGLDGAPRSSLTGSYTTAPRERAGGTDGSP